MNTLQNYCKYRIKSIRKFNKNYDTYLRKVISIFSKSMEADCSNSIAALEINGYYSNFNAITNEIINQNKLEYIIQIFTNDLDKYYKKHYYNFKK